METSNVITAFYHQGVKISRDAYGNMYATRLGNGEIIAKGYRDSSNNCLSNEIVAMHGRIGLEAVKVSLSYMMSFLMPHFCLINC